MVRRLQPILDAHLASIRDMMVEVVLQAPQYVQRLEDRALQLARERADAVFSQCMPDAHARERHREYAETRKRAEVDEELSNLKRKHARVAEPQ